MAVEKHKPLDEASCIARFHRIILSWDFIRLVNEAKVKQQNKENGKIDESLGFRQVKNSYNDVDDYISTYEPLLFEEIKAEIVSQQNEMGAAKTSCMDQCKEDEDGFHLATVPMMTDKDVKESERLRPFDLLLLSKPLFSKPQQEEKQMLPEENYFKKYAFALVERSQADSFQIRMYLAGEVRNLNTDIVEYCPRLSELRSLVTSTDERDRLFDIRKICRLSTVAREYIALRSIGSLPFMDIILAASEKNFDAEGQAWKVSRPLEEFIKDNLNESQQKAIQAGLSRKPFILIQHGLIWSGTFGVILELF